MNEATRTKLLRLGLAATLLASLLFAAAPAPTAHAATYTVNSANDTDDGTCDTAHCSLREAMNAANANAGADTITFSVSGTITLGSTLPLLNSGNGALTIDGAGQTVTISGSNAVRVFNMDTGASLTLQNLTVANGAAPGNYGGGALNNGGTLSVINSTFSGNSAASGGGINNNTSAAALTITNSTFSNNSRSGVVNSGGVVTISNSVFSGNSAGSGGGVFNYNSGQLTITGSAFSGNSATNGGGVYTTDGVAVAITGSAFSGNSATDGGGVLIGGGAATITNSTFSGNSATNNGGGLQTLGGGATITNSTFSGNSATNGGGLSHSSSTNFMSVRNTIVANSASGGNCNGMLTDGGNNIDDGTTCGWGGSNGSMSNTNPNLGAFTGSPGYFPLNAGSPAIDAVIFNAPNNCPANDQRGAVRPQGAYCDVGAYEFPIDLTATKANNVGGVAYEGGSFNWTITVQNTGAGAVSFMNGQFILLDDLPTGPMYGAPVAQNITDVTNGANIECVMPPAAPSPAVLCSASGATVTLGAATGRFDVVFSVSPNAVGALTNPTGGVCRVDPNGLIAENSEANNDCADTVTVSAASVNMQPPAAAPDAPIVPPVNPLVISQSVGASGGTFTSTGGATVIIPASAVPEGSTLHVAPPTPGSAPQVSASFKLFGEPISVEIVNSAGANLRAFDSPLTICMNYTDADLLAAGGNVNNLLIQTAQIGGTWAPLPTTVDTVGKKACVTVNHLTLFGLTARVPTTLPETGQNFTPIIFIIAALIAVLALAAAWVMAGRQVFGKRNR